MRRKLPYKEGDWIAVPLKDNGWGLARIARKTKTGGGLLVYLFGPRMATVPKLEGFQDRSPREAIAIYRCGDVHLLEGKWKVVGFTAWKREEWSVPPFVRHEDFTDRYWMVIRSDDDPYKILLEQRISPEMTKGLEIDSVYGVEALEIKFTKLLKANE